MEINARQRGELLVVRFSNFLTSNAAELKVSTSDHLCDITTCEFMIDHRSYTYNLSSRKILRPERDSNPVRHLHLFTTCVCFVLFVFT